MAYSKITYIAGESPPMSATNLNHAESGIYQNSLDIATNASDISDKAEATTYTGTIDKDDWTGTSAPYSQAVTVTGIASTDNPGIDVTMSGTWATDETRNDEWGYVYRAVTSTNTITFYATDEPTVDLPFQAKVVK